MIGGSSSRSASITAVRTPPVLGTVDSGPTQMPPSMHSPRNSTKCPWRAGLMVAMVRATSMCTVMVVLSRDRCRYAPTRLPNTY